MKHKIIYMIAVLGLMSGILSTPAYAVTSKISANSGLGAIIVGPNTDACVSGLRGAVKFTSGSPGILYYCDGVSTWVPVVSGGTPAGSNTYIQFNSGGAYGASSNYTWDNTNNIVTIGNSLTGAVRTGNGTAALPSHSFNTNSGAAFMNLNVGLTGDGNYSPGTMDSYSTAINITAIGATDWALWKGTSGTPAQRKSGGGSLIGNAALYNGGGFVNETYAWRTISWTDGTPTASGSSTDFPMNTNAGATMGFTVTFPADTTPREARIYFQYYHFNAIRITAIISDGSTANKVYEGMPSSGYNSRFGAYAVVTYAAASASKTLTIRIQGLTSPSTDLNPGIGPQAATVKVLSTPPGPATGLYMSGANTALNFSAGGINSLELGNTASGVNNLKFVPAATGSTPILTNTGSDTNGAGLGVSILAKSATATGEGGKIYMTAGGGNATGAGGAINYTGGAGGATGNGGDITVSAGTGGVTSGSGGLLDVNAGYGTTSSLNGSILMKAGATTYVTIIEPTAVNAAMTVGGTSAMTVPGGTTAQRPGTPVNGMIRYNTTTSKLEARQNGAWANVLANVASLGDFSDARTNYSGTVGSSNSLYSMFLGSGTGTTATAGAARNTAVGPPALGALTTGTDNTSYGQPSMQSITTSSRNTGIGSYTMPNSGNDNTAIGDDTLGSLTSGARNTAVNAGWPVTTGSDNTGFMNAIESINSGTQNTGFGYNALNGVSTTSYNTTFGTSSDSSGSYNTAFGYNSRGGGGSYNTAWGQNSMNSLSSGNNNASMGVNAGQYLTTGSNNVYFGNNAGFFNSKTSSSGNIFIGYGVAASGATPTTNEITIGDLIFASASTGTNYIMIDANQHMNYKSSVPAVSACGTGATIAGNDNTFKVTGGTSVSACTITFAHAWVNAPICNVQTGLNETLWLSSVSTTAITITFSAAGASRPIYVECRGYL